MFPFWQNKKTVNAGLSDSKYCLVGLKVFKESGEKPIMLQQGPIWDLWAIFGPLNRFLKPGSFSKKDKNCYFLRAKGCVYRFWLFNVNGNGNEYVSKKHFQKCGIFLIHFSYRRLILNSNIAFWMLQIYTFFLLQIARYLIFIFWHLRGWITYNRFSAQWVMRFTI
jgi:hypothetical protein